MASVVFEEGAGKREESVECAVVSCFERAAYAIFGEQKFESAGVVGREEVDVEDVGGSLLLKGDEEGNEGLAYASPDAEERALGIDGIAVGKDGF